jgi:hypothetical protein
MTLRLSTAQLLEMEELYPGFVAWYRRHLEMKTSER